MCRTQSGDISSKRAMMDGLRVDAMNTGRLRKKKKKKLTEDSTQKVFSVEEEI